MGQFWGRSTRTVVRLYDYFEQTAEFALRPAWNSDTDRQQVRPQYTCGEFQLLCEVCDYGRWFLCLSCAVVFLPFCLGYWLRANNPDPNYSRPHRCPTQTVSRGD